MYIIIPYFKGLSFMDVDFINIVNFIAIFMCMAILIISAVHVYENCRKVFIRNIIGNILIQALVYFKRLSVDQYVCYEKYGIWRFCVEPDSK